MMLSEQAKAALERFRKHKDGESQLYGDDYWKVVFALTDELLRLYPPRWNEPVTPENLEKCSFVKVVYPRGNVWIVRTIEPEEFKGWESELYCRFNGLHVKWFVEVPKMGSNNLEWFSKPRNMLEVWRLMQRLEIPSPLDGVK